jgi:2-polyprenyl-6-hydroxyphenyl methylase/3-demethylubiquinone-9 3-methyltransferase
VSSDVRFRFGANWRDFVAAGVSPNQVDAAVEGLRRICSLPDLTGKVFLDAGCGSGLSSLAACLLGARRVIAFDFDPESVEASMSLRSRCNIPEERWMIRRGSVLDAAFLASLPQADVVYSWGVLHHTGRMWSAIDHVAALVPPGGVLAVSIYNNVHQRLGGSAMWWHVKRFYNSAPGFVRTWMEAIYIAYSLTRQILALRNPLNIVRNHGRQAGRGMSFIHDIRDWLGGFPYEYATAGEVFRYVHRKFHYELIYLNTMDGHGCNELTFRRPDRP